MTHHGVMPVIVGAGQLSSRRGGDDRPPTPTDLLAEASRAAATDTGSPSILDRVDTVVSLPVSSWSTRNPGAELAAALGVSPARTVLTVHGGDVGVNALAWACAEIRAGRSEVVLLVGAHVGRTVDLAARRQGAVDFPASAVAEPELLGEHRAGNSPEEVAVGLDRPIYLYPLFENALRAWRGQGLGEHRRFMGELFTRFTSVAAKNPHAWFPVERDAAELVEVTALNRMVAFPYTKYLNAVISTDQAAALLVVSAHRAEEVGVAVDRFVHWWGGGHAVERAWFVSQRPDLAWCPAMAQSHHAALRNAEVTVDEIAWFDFYSCFPAPVEMALRVLGLASDDARGFTVTGGLPYAGGPASAYTLHSLATMVGVLREDPGSLGMVTGNGWYMTKHSAVVLSTRPPRAEVPNDETPELAPEAARAADPVPLRRASGTGRVDSYTVAHDHTGEPERGMVVGTFGDGGRFVATAGPDRQTLIAMESAEMVGTSGRVVDDGGPALRFEPQ